MDASSPHRFSVDATLRTGLSRRALLRRAAALGVSAPVVSGLLAACGGGVSEEPTPEATTATGGGTTPPAGGSPAAGTTPAAATPAPTGGFQYEEPQNKGGQIIEGTFAEYRARFQAGFTPPDQEVAAQQRARRQ
ncbi:MAG: hypothetical protein QJR03_07230 [Sphaerobacter sp.]|nr:hypothetical protein [Sphaerobacter sp.]